MWDAAVPPELTQVSLPKLTGDLGSACRGTPETTDLLLRRLDSSEFADFAAVQAAGIHAEDTIQASTIVPRPIGGQVRIAHTIGVR